MLSAVFRGRAIFVVAGSLLTLAVVLVAFVLARRRGAARPACTALYAGAIAGVVLLTLGSGGGYPRPPSCVVNRDLAEPFRDVEGRMNLVMFLPVGLFGVLALRRVGAAALAGVLLACGIETAQALLPALGRACDTSDVETNASGALIGCAAGALWLLLRDRPRDGRRILRGLGGSRRGMLGLGAGCLGVSICALTMITPQNVAHVSGMIDPTDGQRAAAARQTRALAGTQRSLLNVQYSQYETGGTVIAALTGDSTLEIGWSGTHVVRGRFDVGTAPATGLRVPGAPARVTDAAAARRVGVAYLRGHAAWAPTGTHPASAVTDVAGVRRWTFAWGTAHRSAQVTVDGHGRVDAVALDSTGPEASVVDAAG